MPREVQVPHAQLCRFLRQSEKPGVALPGLASFMIDSREEVDCCCHEACDRQAQNRLALE